MTRSRSICHVAKDPRRRTEIRNRAQVTTFFDGLELIEPGVVQLNKWRPDPGDVDPGIEISSWAGLGLKH